MAYIRHSLRYPEKSGKVREFDRHWTVTNQRNSNIVTLENMLSNNECNNYNNNNLRLLLCSLVDVVRCAFSHAAPTVWCYVATDISFADSCMNFCSLLHSHFYRLALINLGHVSPGPTIRLIMSTYWPVNKNI